MSKNISLPEKDVPINLEELKKHFQEYDPITVYSEDPEFSNYDFGTASDDEVRKYDNVETVFSKTWDQQMQMLSERIFLKDYSMDYPVLNIKKKAQQIVATTVMRILRNKQVYDNVMKIGYDVLKDPFAHEIKKYCKAKGKLTIMLSEKERAMIFDQLADQFLSRMVSLLHYVLDLPEIVRICKTNDAIEDFNHGTGNKSRKKHLQKWNHTRVKHVEIVSLDDLFEGQKEDTMLSKSTQNTQEAQLVVEFCKDLDDVDKQIVLLSYDGCTQKEIAEIIGFASHSAISKRKERLHKQFKLFVQDWDD